MSTATDDAVLVFKITLAIGQILWKNSVTNCLMQNKPVRIVITGSHAAALGTALKLQLPTITWEFRPMTVMMVLILTAVVQLAIVQPLVDVLNAAFNRGYQVRVRYKKKGAGSWDDELIFELLP